MPALKDHGTGSINTLFLLLAGITLIIGAVGVANTTLTESTAAGRPGTYPALRAARIEPVEALRR